MPRSMQTALLIGACVGLSACAEQVPPRRPTVSGTTPPHMSSKPMVSKAPSSSTSQIAISDEIRKACGIADEDAYFAFDSSRIDPRAENVLLRVATCFRSGPLAGRNMHLVGRADPRGDDEYNMVLGEHRAASVRTTLVGLGVGAKQITTTSRGELDARGTDEASWALDRRVDVLLGS